MPNTPPKPQTSAQRRPLPPARRTAAYEIVVPKRPRVSLVGSVFRALRDAWGRGGEAVGDAYAAGARVALDRKEALEDLNAERRQRARAAAAPKDSAVDLKTGS